MAKTMGHMAIQSDSDGMVSLQCYRCKARFKMSCKYIVEELDGDIFCPICGMPEDMTGFYTDEAREAAAEVIMNNYMDDVTRLFQSAFSGHSSKRSGLKIKVRTSSVPRKSSEIVMQSRDHTLDKVESPCCKKQIALSPTDIIAGYYCPYCGRIIK